MNGGIHDAFFLADNLIKAFKDNADERHLDAYEAQRRPVALSEIIPLADANRKRHECKTLAEQKEFLERMKRIAGDRRTMKEHLRRVCMLDGVEKSTQLAM